MLGEEWVYGAVTLLALGNGLMWPSFMAILGNMGDSEIQGTIMGYGNSMGSAASICGLVMGGLLFNYLGPNVFYLAGGIIFFIFILSFRLKSAEEDEE